MEITGYMWAWIFYLVATVGLVVVFWKMTRNLHRVVKRGLRALLVVVFYTPINIVDEGIWFAPAYLVGSYDWIQGNHAQAILALQFMGAAYLLIVALVLLESVFRRFFHLEKA